MGLQHPALSVLITAWVTGCRKPPGFIFTPTAFLCLRDCLRSWSNLIQRGKQNSVKPQRQSGVTLRVEQRRLTHRQWWLGARPSAGMLGHCLAQMLWISFFNGKQRPSSAWTSLSASGLGHGNKDTGHLSSLVVPVHSTKSANLRCIVVNGRC